MKKIALFFLVLIASGFYVWAESRGEPRGCLPDALGLSSSGAGDPKVDLPPVPAGMAADPPVAAARPAVFVVSRPAVEAPAIASARTEPEPPPPERQPVLPAPVAVASVTAEADPAEQVQSPATSVPVPRLRPVAKERDGGLAVIPVSMTMPGKMMPSGSTQYADGTYVGPVTDAYYGLVQIEAIIQGGRLSAIKVLKYPSDRRTSVYINRQALPMLRDEVVAAQSARVDIVSGATLTSRAFMQSLSAALAQAKA